MTRRAYRFGIGSLMILIAACGLCLAAFRTNVGLGIVAICVALLTLSRVSAVRHGDAPPSTPLEWASAWAASSVIALMMVLTAGCALAFVVALLIWIPFVNIVSPFLGLGAALFVVGRMRRALWPPPALTGDDIRWLDDGAEGIEWLDA
jgi:hypothetical protein